MIAYTIPKLLKALSFALTIMKRIETLSLPLHPVAAQGTLVGRPWSAIGSTIAIGDGLEPQFGLNSNDRGMEAHTPNILGFNFNLKTIAPKPQSRSGWRYHNAPN